MRPRGLCATAGAKRLRRAVSAAPQGRMKYRATVTHALPARLRRSRCYTRTANTLVDIHIACRVLLSVLRGYVFEAILRHHVKEERLQPLYDLAFTFVATTHELDEITTRSKPCVA